MLSRCCLLMVLAILWLPAARADEDAKAARATLDRAVNALGGPKLLAARALSGTSRGSIHILAMKAQVTNQWTVQGLDQVKWTTEVAFDANAAPITVVVDKDKGWFKANNGAATPLPKPQLTPFLQGMAGLRIAETLLPLTEKGWTLSSLGETKIDDTPAVGIKVARKGLPEMDLFFDKETHLPIKAEMRIKDTDSMEGVYVARFAAYKKVEGRQYFTKLKVTRDEMVVLEMERSDLKAKDKVDDETFAKP